MTARDLLAEVHRCGAVAYRIGDRLRIRPADAVTPELVDRLRQHKAELLPLVPERPPAPSVKTLGPVGAGLTATADTDLAAIETAVAYNGQWVADEIVALERRCVGLARADADETVFRAAVVLLVARLAELRCRHGGTPAPRSTARHLVMTRNHPAPGPVTLDDGTTIEDVPRFIGRVLVAVDYVLAHDGRNDVLPVYLEQLETLGVSAAVEWVQ